MAELMQLYLSNRKDITSPGPSRATFIQTTSTTDSRRRSNIWNKQKTDTVKGEIQLLRLNNDVSSVEKQDIMLVNVKKRAMLVAAHSPEWTYQWTTCY